MHDSPSSKELLTAVIDFLTQVAGPQLSGQAQFHARVSANALALVKRELEGRDAADARAIRLYRDILTRSDGDLETLEARLCDAIRKGYIDVATPGLLESLRAVTAAQLAIDQPTYRGVPTP